MKRMRLHRWVATFPVVSLVTLMQCAHPLPADDARGTNAPPIVRSLSVTPQAVLIGRWVTIRVEAEDPDNDPLTYRWSSTAGDIIGDGLEVRYTASYCCVGINTVRVRIEDGRGGITTRSVDVPVVQ